jgi:hypothetical protein
VAITIHQRSHLWLWHWRDGPGWVRDPQSAELRSLREAGARVIRVHLQDDGPVPRELVDGYKAAGWKVWGAMRPSHAPLGGSVWEPFPAAEWAAAEKRRLALDGLDMNFEDEVRRADNDSSGTWSEAFATRFRQLCPTLSCGLDTYYGSAGGGLNLGAYVTRAFRMNVQTYWGSEGIWDDPTTRIVEWCKGAQPSIPKANVKPVFRVTANNSGQSLDQDRAIADSVRAGTKGAIFYYLDGAELSYLREFIRKAIADGISY